MAEELRDIEPLRPLLEKRPLALVSDIDGTLAPIVPHPEDASVTLRARTAIQGLIRLGVKVAFVTGRPLDTARRMAGIQKAYYAANHGLDVWVEGQVETSAKVLPYVSWARQVLAEIGEIASPGVVIEDKGAILAFHYRLAPDDTAALGAILAAVNRSAAAKHFSIQEGRKVLELRPPLEVNKGTAACDLVTRMGAAAVVGMGDDLTDIQMFEGIRGLRVPGVLIGVWNLELPEVVEAADYFVRGVEGVEWMLEEMAKAMSGE